jgi:hypothetical protein
MTQFYPGPLIYEGVEPQISVHYMMLLGFSTQDISLNTYSASLSGFIVDLGGTLAVSVPSWFVSVVDTLVSRFVSVP